MTSNSIISTLRFARRGRGHIAADVLVALGAAALIWFVITVGQGMNTPADLSRDGDGITFGGVEAVVRVEATLHPTEIDANGVGGPPLIVPMNPRG